MPNRRDSEFRIEIAVTDIGRGFAISWGMSITSSGHDPQTYAIIGAAMEVHRVLGPGYLETYFREALQIEFDLRGIPFKTEVPCLVEYKGHVLSGTHRMDFVCYESVVVEVKARSVTGPAEHAQVLNYLAAMTLERGLLLNFGGRSLEFERFALSSANRSRQTNLNLRNRRL